MPGWANNTDPDHERMGLNPSHSSLEHIISTRARDLPSQIALIDPNQSLTYGELDAEINRYAEALGTLGVVPGMRVGVVAAKSIPVVVTLYALLRLGAVVAPIDAGEPSDRLQRMTQGVDLSVLICDLASRSRVAGVVQGLSRARVVHSRPFISADEGFNASDLFLFTILPQPRQQSTGVSSAYLYFTSGTTGAPKGVLLSHENILHFAVWAQKKLQISHDDVVGSQASLGFDLSTLDLFGAALGGATVSLVPDFVRAFPTDFVKWLATNDVSVLYAVPSLYYSLLKQQGFREDRLLKLRALIYAGEPFNSAKLSVLRNRFPAAEVHNFYGPTETNVCSSYLIPADWSEPSPVYIGTPITGTHIEVVDEHRRPGKVGELAVSGPGVMQGYVEKGMFHDPKVAITCSDNVTRNCYLTGDHGGWTDTGELHLTGRQDSQVKRRGHRIDLQTIESLSREITDVDECAAVFVDTEEGGLIVLYAATKHVDSDQLGAELNEVLPARMVPDKIIIVGQIPLNSRAKVDRARLIAQIQADRKDNECKT